MAQQVKKGLEIGCLAIVDINDISAYSMKVVYTLMVEDNADDKEQESLVKHYAKVITERVADIVNYSSILVLEGYFMKKSHINNITAVELTVITKGRQNADMHYLYKGVQSNGKGRKKVYGGKVR